MFVTDDTSSASSIWSAARAMLRGSAFRHRVGYGVRDWHKNIHTKVYRPNGEREKARRRAQMRSAGHMWTAPHTGYHRAGATLHIETEC